MAKPRKNGMPDKRANNGGQNRWLVDDDTLKKIERMAMVGMTIPQIAAVCDIHPDTLNNHKDEIASWVAKGKGKGIAQVAGSLFTKAVGNKDLGISPDVTAQIFYLKTQARWRDSDPDEFMNEVKRRAAAAFTPTQLTQLLESTKDDATEHTPEDGEDDLDKAR